MSSTGNRLPIAVTLSQIMQNDANANSGSEESSEERKTRVMVVDDSPGVQQSLILLLLYFGFEVAPFLDGSEAILATKSFHPDALICDAHINEMTNSEDFAPEHIEGVETASAIQHQWPQCRVIVMSGNLKESVLLDRAEKLGAHIQVMPKPSSPDMLISALKAATA
jgi:CheY-like chemotaxis protein